MGGNDGPRTDFGWEVWPNALHDVLLRITKADAAIPAAAVRLLAPLPRPEKNVFCVGRNYREHIAEGERAQNVKIGVTEVPVYFTKPRTAVVGPGAEVPPRPAARTGTPGWCRRFPCSAAPRRPSRT